MHRSQPNILICGTPGTGKTTLCERIVEHTHADYINVGNVVREQRLYSEWDDALDVPIVDDDMLNEYLGPLLEDTSGGKMVDFHDPSSFEADWFDLIVVLQADTAVLWSRLEARGYEESKIRENVQCEIFQVVREAIQEMMAGSDDDGGDDPAGPVLLEATNNTLQEQEATLRKILQYVSSYCCDDEQMVTV